MTPPGEWEVNPTLLYVLRSEHDVDLCADELFALLDDTGHATPDVITAT